MWVRVCLRVSGIVAGGYLLYPHHTRPVAIPTLNGPVAHRPHPTAVELMEGESSAVRLLSPDLGSGRESGSGQLLLATVLWHLSAAR